MKMMRTTSWLIHAATCAALLIPAATASADTWDDRSVLTFSSPVMVPGTTLAPGRYQFEIPNPTMTTHLVRITNLDTGQLMATVQAVPTKRTDVTGETVLKFDPTDAGAPVALKAWFYPGDVYGHEFVYSGEQARHIAERTKTIVLSSDTPFGEPTAGALRIYDASGKATPWTGDPEATKSWEAWRQSRPAGTVVEETADAPESSTAPAIVRAGGDAKTVAIDDLEAQPGQYLGTRVSVDAEVEHVFGPRAFTIDEPEWMDLDGEVMVFMPTTLAALVREDDRVTVTGTVRRASEISIDHDNGWFFDDPHNEIELRDRTVIVADRIVGGDSDSAVMISTPRPDASGTAPIASVDTLASGTGDLVGRSVKLDGVRVSGTNEDGGFYVASGGRQVYVMPADHGRVDAGAQVSIEGVVMPMPRRVERRIDATGELNDDIYLYALNVQS